MSWVLTYDIFQNPEIIIDGGSFLFDILLPPSHPPPPSPLREHEDALVPVARPPKGPSSAVLGSFSPRQCAQPPRHGIKSQLTEENV